MGLLRAGNVARVTKELDFKFYLILIKFGLKKAPVTSSIGQLLRTYLSTAYEVLTTLGVNFAGGTKT